MTWRTRRWAGGDWRLGRSRRFSGIASPGTHPLRVPLPLLCSPYFPDQRLVSLAWDPTVLRSPFVCSMRSRTTLSTPTVFHVQGRTQAGTDAPPSAQHERPMSASTILSSGKWQVEHPRRTGLSFIAAGSPSSHGAAQMSARRARPRPRPDCARCMTQLPVSAVITSNSPSCNFSGGLRVNPLAVDVPHSPVRCATFHPILMTCGSTALANEVSRTSASP